MTNEDGRQIYQEFLLNGRSNLEKIYGLLMTGDTRELWERAKAEGIVTQNARYTPRLEEEKVDGKRTGHLLWIDVEPLSDDPNIPRAIHMMKPSSIRQNPGITETVTVVDRDGNRHTANMSHPLQTDKYEFNTLNTLLADLNVGVDKFFQE